MGFTYLNTTHVSVQLKKEVKIPKSWAYLNTTHVSVQLQSQEMGYQVNYKFKYNPCIGSIANYAERNNLDSKYLNTTHVSVQWHLIYR